jgi:hypothetical protein
VNVEDAPGIRTAIEIDTADFHAGAIVHIGEGEHIIGHRAVIRNARTADPDHFAEWINEVNRLGGLIVS